MKKSACILIVILICWKGVAQNKSNRGKEFWLGYGFHWIFTNPDGAIALNAQEMALYISTEQAAQVTVSINGTSWSQSLNIPANTVDASILIPKSGVNDARILSDGLSTKGIHIVSDVPVAVYAHVYVTQGSGATMLMPVETYGYSYYSVNYKQNTSASPLPFVSTVIQNGPDWYSWFYIVASEDNTRVQITPSDTTKNGWLPGQNYSVNLNKGEIYTVYGKMVPNNNQSWAASKDMTGSKVIAVAGNDGSCHPFALFSGSSGIRICRGDGGEYMQQQMFPSQAWGTRYLTYHTINNTNTDINETNRNYYRVCVSDPSTVVKRNGSVLTGLVNNFYYEYMDSTGGDYIEADKPILISQYMVNKNQCWNYPITTPSPPSNGDPEMFYLSPIEQGQKSVRFFASRQSTAVSYVYTNIVIPTAGIASLKVDGISVSPTQIITHPNNSLYSVALVRFIGPAAQHTITSDSSFNATVYGLGNYESYGYNVGTLINNLNYYSTIRNTQNATNNIDSFSCPKTPLRMFLKIGFQATSINWKLSQVTGITPNADSIINNPVPVRTELINGRTYYVYTLQQDFTFNAPGLYTIPVTYTATVIPNCSQSENATVQVLIKPGPTADFTIASSGNNCVKDSIQFNGIVNASGFTITQYLWNFPDNTTSSQLNPGKKFTTTGPQAIRFRVYADNGCAADTTKTITIQSAAVANFTMNSTACAGDSVLVTDNSSISSGTITSWEWNYFNTSYTKSNNSSFYIHYPNVGTYTVNLIVTASNGCKSDTAKQGITVYAKPIAKFGYSGNICVSDSIKFSDSSSISSGNISKWYWNFGNGQSVKTNSTPFYVQYTATGNYNVLLQVESDHGCKSDTARENVVVNSKPTANMTITGAACIDSTINFSSSIITGPATWYWNFGDGTFVSSTTSGSTQHTYTTTANNINVKHVVSYGPSCTSDTVVSVINKVAANPTATITLLSDTLCQDKSIIFSGTSTIANVNWLWVIDNKIVAQAPPLIYQFNHAGLYSVSLVVKTTEGCNSAPVQTTADIHALPQLSAGPDKVINPGNSVTLNATLSNFTLYDITWTPSTTLSAINILNPTATPANPTTYTISVIDKTAHCTAKDDVFVNVVVKLAIPNAFSPNGDGINDKWIIPGLEIYSNASVSMFDRYGQMLFEKKNYNTNPWDGTLKGTNLPVGTYYYLISLNNENKEKLSGAVILLR